MGPTGIRATSTPPTIAPSPSRPAPPTETLEAAPRDGFALSGKRDDLGLIPSMYPLVGGRVEPEQADQMLQQAPGWQMKDVEGFPRLERQYKFKNFTQAMAFSGRVAEFAEKQKHHPSLLTEWGKVTVGWWTHDVGGLHANDFLSAQRTDAVFQADQAPPTTT